jgi:toxin FitB
LILLDTNVVSELLRPQPAAVVVGWLNRHFPECALSSIIIFELISCIKLLPEGKRRDAVEAGVGRIIRRFGPRVYGFDAPAAYASASLLATARQKGLGLHQVPAKLTDLQIGGIAIAYGLVLATRNVSDFRDTAIPLIDPWNADA